MFTVAQFKALINKHGADRVLSIQSIDFAGQIFDDNRQFSLAEYFDEATESFTFPSIDMYGNTILTVIPLAGVRAILFAESGVSLNKYKRSYLKG